MSFRYSPNLLESGPVHFHINMKSPAWCDPDTECRSRTYQPRQSMNSEVKLTTQRPLWNSEIGVWQHNFGTRVKRDSFKNFIVVRNPEYVDAAMEPESYGNSSTINSMGRVCIRHGQVSYLSPVECPNQQIFEWLNCDFEASVILSVRS